MKKIKLSEVIVNASKLANQMPEYYNHRAFGLGASTNDVQPYINDYNIDLPTGFYTGAASNTVNAPATGTYTLLHIKRGPGYYYQLAFSLSAGGDIYYRNSVNNNWSTWKQITMSI